MNLPWRAPLTGAWARTGWLVTTLILAATLFLSSWANYRAAHAAVNTLNTGQAEIISTALRASSMRGGLPQDTATLHLLLESQREAGLRYIALLDADGNVDVSVGEAIAPITLPDQLRNPPHGPPAPLLIAQGDRMRFFESRPTFRGGGRFQGFNRRDDDGDARDAPDARGLPARGTREEATPAEPGRFTPPAGFGQGGPPRSGFFLLEFEPVPASNIMTQATASLALSAIGAGLLTLVSMLFWRMSMGYDEARQRYEQQKRLSQLGEMSAVLAHEIRNPLASLKGNAQLLAEKMEAGSRDRRRADRVVSEAVRLEALTTDLLDFARTGPITRTPIDPAGLLRVAVEEVANGGVRLQVDGAPPHWSMDEARVRQALVNLISNAVQVSPEGQPPVAALAQQGGRLVYTVRDFGPGLKDEDRERIFEPFFTTRTNGTGLGLSVARRVVEMHGGTLTADNHPDGGAVFRITLPDGAN